MICGFSVVDFKLNSLCTGFVQQLDKKKEVPLFYQGNLFGSINDLI